MRPSYSWHFVEAYLRSTSEGHYQVLILGKNGEPQPHLKLSLSAKHRVYQDEASGRYQTDEEGVIHLGALEGVDWVDLFIPYAPGRSEVKRRWKIPKNRYFERPRNHDIFEGEVFRVPIEAAKD